MKRIIKGNRKLYSAIAGTLTVALVGTSIHLSSQQALAKETFQGIKDIMEENSMYNPFQIIELVPGTAMYTVDVKDIDGTDPVTLNLSLGEMGYYIDGEEPTEFDENLKLLPGSESRYTYAEALLKADENGNLVGGALKDITSQENDGTKPLYYIPYEEEYNLAQLELEDAITAGNPWKELKYDITPDEQVISRRQMVSALDGRFLKTYSPRDEEGKLPGADTLRDEFRQVISDLTVSGNETAADIAFRAGNGKGDFDPNFYYDAEGNYNVKFEKNNGAFGYRVVETQPAYKGDPDVAPGTYIYERYVSGNSVFYKYAGVYSELEALFPDLPKEESTDGDVDSEGDEPHKRSNLGEDGEAEDEDVRSSEDEDVNGSEEGVHDSEDGGVNADKDEEGSNESEDIVSDTGASAGDNSGSQDQQSGDQQSQEQQSQDQSSQDQQSQDQGLQDQKSTEGSSDSQESKNSDGDEKKEQEASDEKKDEDKDDKEKEEKNSDEGDKQARAFVRIRPHAAHDTGDEVSAKETISDFLDDAKGDHDEDDAEFEEIRDEDTVKENVSAVEEEYMDVSGYEEDEPEEVSVEDVLDEVEEDVSMAEPEQAAASGEYFIVYFGYDDSNDLGVGEYSYSISGWSPVTTPASDAYKLYADEAGSAKSFVVPNFSGTGSLRAEGESDFLYEAKTPRVDEEGNLTKFLGNYNLIKPENSSDAGIYRVKNIVVYYRGVFGNSNWFTLYVFDRDAAYTDNGEPTVYYSYITARPEALSNMEVGNTGILYISAALGRLLPEGARLKYTDIDGIEQDTRYVKDVNDITTSTMMNILDAVVNSDLPVMVDYSLITDESLKGTNIQKLAMLLNQEDVSIFYEDNALKADNVIDTLDIPKDYFKLNPKDHHVNKSVYVYNYSESPETMATQYFVEESNEYKPGVGTGFDEIRDQINDENMYREVNGTRGALIESTVNEAVAIKYIISYRGRKSAYVKESVKILEIQPRAVPEDVDDKFEGHLYVEEIENPNDDKDIRYALKRKGKDNDTYILGSSNFEKALPNEITLVSMAVNEFVGRDADINSEYDMIYIGLSPYHFNREKDDDGNWRSKFNDSDMDGLLYTNIGDRIRVRHNVAGLMDKDIPLKQTEWNGGRGNSDYTNVMRGPGNDLTESKVEALRSYLKGGYPVLVDHNCFDGDDDERNASVYDGVNSDHSKGYIDNASHMYEFLEIGRDSIGDGINSRNFFRLDKNNEVTGFTTMLNWSLNLPKPVMEVELNGDMRPNEGYAEAAYSGNDYYLDYRIEILDKRSTDEDDTYDIELYLDWNNDGKYSAKTEVADYGEVTITNGNSQVKRNDGKYKLKIGKTYKLRYRYDIDRYKARPIAWKLVAKLNRSDELSTEESKARRSEAVGCYFVRSAKSEPEVIKVLQLLPDECKIKKNADGNWEHDGGNLFWDMEHDSIDGRDWTGGGGWKTALGRVADEYDLEITSLRTSELIEKLQDPENADFIESHDVLVLGFANYYSALADDLAILDDPVKKAYAKMAAGKIQAWVEGDNATVIGTETCGFFQVPYKTQTDDLAKYGGVAISSLASGWNNNLWAGFDMTKRLRALAGQDCYGITQRTDPLTEGKQVSIADNMGDKLKTLKGNTEEDENFLKDLNTFGVEYPYVPNGEGKLTGEADGYTDFLLAAFKPSSKDDGYGSNYYTGFNESETTSSGYSAVDGYLNHNPCKDKLRMNIGTMTLYPNKLDDRVQNQDNTHLPVYQLDLTGDGYIGAKDDQPDVTVWYTYKGGNTELEANSGDARQSYFLYSRGNLTFVNMLKTPHNDMLDFMINVLINAAVATPEAANIQFYDGKTTASGSSHKVYLPYEDINDSASSLVDDSIELYFKPDSFIEGSTDVLTEYYIQTNSETYDKLADDGVTKLKKIASPVVTKVDSEVVLTEKTVEIRKTGMSPVNYTGIALDDSSRETMYTLHLSLDDIKDNYFEGRDWESAKVYVYMTAISGRTGVDSTSNSSNRDDKRKIFPDTDCETIIKTDLFALD